MSIPKSTLDRIRSEILPLNRELCGYLRPLESGEVEVITAAEGKFESGRPTCTLPEKGNFVWHSHYLETRSYPSGEDMLSIMKKRDTLKHQDIVQLIFSRWGIWELRSDRKDKFADVPAQLAYLTERGHDIYRACNGGKTDYYNLAAINAILARAMYHYQPLGLRIKFTPWTDILDNYLITFPIINANS